jgi:hypothetical protein
MFSNRAIRLPPDSPTGKIMLSLTTFSDELEREKARQRTYDAMARKARAGHVTGGRVFGYDNVDVAAAGGKRSHVERRINEAEAAVVRRIFEWCAAGTGYTRITKLLNAERALAAYHKRGTSVCGNGLAMRIERIDDAVLGTLGGDVLRPEVVMAILDGVVEAMSPTTCAR